MNNWVNRNSTLVNNYRSQWIAYNLKGIIAHGKELVVVKSKAETQGEEFVLFYVPDFFGSIHFAPVRFRTFSVHFWSPQYSVTLRNKDSDIAISMLVDSGADCSLIPKSIGETLGLHLADAETIQLAKCVGGTVRYVLRNIEFFIDEQPFTAPVAWVQDEECTDVILGREVIFDLFDIEFKQADEVILFKKR
ncbi:MAG: retropepsin-like domain-containing protein [Bacteroidetes bacterium]|nr:retropepsin-like domain-containing protein [Bacteroidota bacterium]MBU1719197.1 retropepsin-like domain-containing protein [Bacteroidota bacterium]